MKVAAGLRVKLWRGLRAGRLSCSDVARILEAIAALEAGG